MTVGLVIVSHSAQLAEGVAELAGQMSQGKTPIAAAGGTVNDVIGTSVDRIVAAIQSVEGPDGVLVLLDLGSAILSTEMAIEMLDDDRRGRDTVFPVVFRLVAEAHGQVDRAVRGEVVAWPAGAAVQRHESRADRGHEDAQRARLTRSPAHPRGGAPVPVREIAVVVADADRTLVLPPLGTGGGVERDHAAQWRGRVQRPVHQDGRGFEAPGRSGDRPCAPPTRAARPSRSLG